MRLGDLDALKEDLKQYFSDGTLDSVSAKLTFNMVLRKIDNAPTVDLKDIYQEGYYDGHLEGYTKAINEERPQGKWENDSDNLPICNKCGEIALQRIFVKMPHLIQDVRMVRSNYCPNCGADMKGGNDND